MGLNLIDFLLPKEGKFFLYMNQQIDIFCEACKTFETLTQKIKDLTEDEIKIQIAKIKEFELKGDNIERFIIKKLDTTFITPIEREDIHSIVINVDKSMDLINSVSQKIDIYRIKKLPQSVCKFSRIIVEGSEELRKLIRGLKNKEDPQLLVKNIHILENEADTLFHIAMAELLSKKNHVVEIIKFKDIYEELENVVNSLDYIAKLVRGIKVKQG